LGPLLLTGMACFGAAVANGLLAASTSRPAVEAAAATRSRRLAILSIVFASGIGIQGVVAGLLAIFLGEVRGPTAALLAAGPAVVGAIVGLGLIVRRAGTLDARVSTLAVAQIILLAVLGIVVALLAVIIVEEGTTRISDWPFVLLGLAAGASAFAIGATGAWVIPTMTGTDESTATAMYSAQIARFLPFEAVGFGASTIAVLLVAAG
jgi:hypothetical protein